MDDLEHSMASWRKLPPAFYLRPDVVLVARELLGKVLVTGWQGRFTAGRIVETEAYAGELDRASHAYRGRTPRTTVMFENGGTAYVYLCYGLHQMFNIVTNRESIPHAVLIRALEPLTGIDIMLERTGKKKLDHTLTRGPGNVGKAMGFHTSQCGVSLQSEDLFIADDGYRVADDAVAVGPRIGVDYAGEDALLPYRFFLKGSPYVSGKKQYT
ncbi:DNA-3-methyladenine glycosylase [Cnuella takakiae]|uniref:Putative 3-methyladenine DNA glycosylase n=1 Tax=Cnuella takakiae TaxID=1302690 RepID=A0A1M5J693_9BACT|nr:DNA-3-methyladenine glycosylase [Cnuella takakiae]SHG36062.1 DNA-3-methyladenine glycosylase [Cnuella takakiae]